MDAHELGKGGGSMRDAGKSVDHLLMVVFEWTSGDLCVHVTVCVCNRVIVW